MKPGFLTRPAQAGEELLLLRNFGVGGGKDVSGCRGVGVSGYRGGPWKIGEFLAQMGAVAG